jgi:hypothetical protein
MAYRGQEYQVSLRDGAATFSGIEWNNGTKPILVWHQDKTNIVFKIPSGSHWSGRGSSSSHPGQYLVTEIIGIWEPDEQGITRARVKTMFTMPVSARGRGRTA